MNDTINVIKLVGSKQRWVRCTGCEKFYKIVSSFKIEDGVPIVCECSSCGSMKAIAINPNQV